MSTPTPASTATLEQRTTPTATAQASPAQDNQAVITNWEEMFRFTQSYEYVKANGRPDDKAWWVEQAKRFYIGRARAEQLQQIEQMFQPNVAGVPGFIGNARYTVEVQGCSSSTECVLRINVQGGEYWAFDIGQKRWNEANPVEPAVWVVTMRYDPTTGRWKIS
jgi:hypothetical protein